VDIGTMSVTYKKQTKKIKKKEMKMKKGIVRTILRIMTILEVKELVIELLERFLNKETSRFDSEIEGYLREQSYFYKEYYEPTLRTRRRNE
jgi:hypothetical protein